MRIPDGFVSPAVAITGAAVVYALVAALEAVVTALVVQGLLALRADFVQVAS